MLVMKYLLILAGVGLFGSAAALVVYDIFISSQLRRLLRRNSAAGDPSAVGAGASGGGDVANFLHDIEHPLRPIRWRLARQFVISAVVPLLLALSIVVIPDGSAGVRVSQIWGARPGTLYPGVHIVTPLIDSVVLYDTREQVYTTRATEPRQAENDGDETSAAKSGQKAVEPRRAKYEGCSERRRSLARASARRFEHRAGGERALSARSATFELYPRKSAAGGRRRSGGSDGRHDLSANRAELRHQRNFCDETRRAAHHGRERDHGAAGERRNHRARSFAARSEIAGRIRARGSKDCC